MKIFAIIVTYNAMHRGWIDRCMQSLQSSTIPIIAIVVDNLSTDGTREHVPACYPDAIWLPQDKNLGFGQANNVGIRYAMKHNPDYVLLLNQDATIAPNALSLLIGQGDNESLMSPLQLNGDGSQLDFMFRVRMRAIQDSFFDDNSIRHQLKEQYSMPNIPAACWLMPKSLIEKIGGFNPLFFHYGEDDNYHNRIQYHKIRTIVIPQAFMYHDREIHGNQQMHNKKYCRRLMLINICDINKTLIKVTIECFRLLLRCYTEYYPQHSYKPGEFISSLFWILWHVKSIRHSRKIEKKSTFNWL